MEIPKKTGAIILAAGKSVRFGSDKRLVDLNGVPMFLHTAKVIQRVLNEDVWVVLSNHSEQHIDCLKREGINFLEMPFSSPGMGDSIAYAVSCLKQYEGWLICPADLPFIQESTIRAMIASTAYSRLAAPFYDGQQGHPVWFSNIFFTQLVNLGGDKGAKKILQENAGFLMKIPVNDRGCIMDFDTPEILEQERSLAL
ncbi:nucleotidyltransferase family protein [Advenella sp. WQ 585]|uniref:Nucleotidyltransferase family protein n=1 Tax=Advenella mandrilli TaxID=2800330 RepID=A0ABS1EH05_9BURK|nr:nucleotidyltransferase family protein [Advenella mandrilli]MBK1782312.1 nucleotidyltransferase family protein [Advenella mandrilli]